MHGVELIFLDFRENFRSFETWCVRRRREVLQARYTATHKSLMQSLRKPKPDQVDSVQIQRTYTVLAVDSDSQQIHLDAPLDLRGCSSWKLDGVPVEVVSSTGDVCTVSTDGSLFTEAELEQHQVLASCIDIQHEFETLWEARWGKHASPDASDWRRISQFARAFLPRGTLELQPVSYEQWRSALRRFKPRAARGADGFSHRDLLQMPRARTLELLRFFSLLESGNVGWPDQLLTGLVLAHAKPTGQGVQAYRPICVFSVLYRTWAGIRARQCLHHLKNLTGSGAYGFLPQRETTELWMLLEASIELSCQCGSDCSGFSVDIVKCFNNLPRAPVGEAARLLGLPECVLRPWEEFLSRATRRFVVRSCVGRPLLSISGFPEGCPLSTVAMVVTGRMFHQYMQHFAPAAQSLSYVDNFMGHAVRAGQAVTGLNFATCFCDAMGLDLDPAKTYMWSNNGPDRRALKALQLPVLEATRELGGFFAFGRAVRNQALQSRCRELAPLFAALSRSPSPLEVKLGCLPVKFWPRALHGIAGCPVSLQVIASLRSEAVKALHIQVGGASALLRLSINARMDCDPGFYQAWQVLCTMRRVCLKQVEMLTMWRVFCNRHDGARLHGPFTKMFEVMDILGWSLNVPPRFADHEGLEHDLLRIPTPLLRRLVESAWLRHVALAHRHRSSMRDLLSIDPDLLGMDRAKLGPIDLARQCALQSGSFVFGHSQSKFDPQQDGLCARCGVKDDARHRLCVCPLYAEERRPFQWVCNRWEALPDCLTHHLLVPGNPYGPAIRQCLHSLPDTCLDQVSLERVSGTQHLFTDGSCLHSGVSGLALAGWGLAHSGTGLVLACGQVAGLLQSAPRAELCAMLSAVSWVAKVQVPTVVWADALHVVDKMQCLLHDGLELNEVENRDLWERIATEVEKLETPCLQILHTPSHLDKALCESPMEEWLATWNEHADTVAVLANLNRPLQIYMHVPLDTMPTWPMS